MLHNGFAKPCCQNDLDAKIVVSLYISDTCQELFNVLLASYGCNVSCLVFLSQTFLLPRNVL